MAKQKNDERNTLLVVGCPDGSIKKAVSKWHIDNVFTTLELNVRLRMENGKPIDPNDLLTMIQDAKKQIDGMVDPTRIDD
jgi:hypothetical protein